MRRRVLLFAVVAAMIGTPVLAESVVPTPGAKDLCPVCGMLVAKYPNWIAVLAYQDGHAHFFDGAKDFFKFLASPKKYDAAHRHDQVAAMWVTEFYGLTRIDAKKAIYVTNSDVLGPMGHELVPLASEADAREFLRDHQGAQLLTFDQVTPAILNALDRGKGE